MSQNFPSRPGPSESNVREPGEGGDDPDTPAEPGARKRSGRRSRLSREDIIRTAATCFYANGYADTTLAAVAGELKVTDKAIYYYFRNKDALYLETLIRCMEWVDAILDSVAEGDQTGLEKVKEFARAIVGQSPARRPYLRCLPEHLEQTPLGKRFRAMECAQEDILVAWVREGIGDGSIRAADPELLWRWNQGALIWLDAWARNSGNYNPEVTERAAMAMLERSLGAARGSSETQ